MNVTEDLIKKVKNRTPDLNKKPKTSEEKKDKMGMADVGDLEVSSFPVDLYVWYGYYEKGKKRERYRFTMEPITSTFLGGKPLRKITRSGKYPFAGGAFIRRPGLMLGKSLVRLIAPVVNAFNNVFNQISDFQYQQNCPFGFFKPDESYQNTVYELEPGVLYPTPTPEDVNFPNTQRSMAWAYDHVRLLFELLEKLTGAASYFMTNARNVSGTATRDKIIEEKSETRFGLWVKRIQADVSEGLTMLVGLYQDWAPPKLGSRVLGEEGKKLFNNLSVDTLRGQYDARMKPDVIAGSKALDKEIKTWGFMNLSQSVWLDPRVNPRGNWKLTAEAAKAVGYTDIESYLGPEPPQQAGTSDEVEGEFTRMAQGEIVVTPETANPVEHYFGHMQQKQQRYFDLDEEYRPNFDQHLFAAMKTFNDYIRKVQQERMADQMALRMMNDRETGIRDEVENGKRRKQAPAPGPGTIPGQAEAGIV